MEGYRSYPKGFSTAAIHHAQEPEQWDSMAVVAPLVTSTTFLKHDARSHKNYEYAREGNPTREILEKLLAKLDGVEYGLSFSSGLGAITSLLYLVKSGDSIIVGTDMYGGTLQLTTQAAENYNIDLTYVDLTDLKALKRAIKPNTKLILGETPTNPTLKVLDLKAISSIAKERNIIFALDNTFSTPYLQRPHEFNVDLVMYSLTKYMNGHSDVVMGAITTSNKDIYSKLHVIQGSTGIVPSPFDCYQVTRSLKTLSLRMKQHSQNSLALAQFLESHPKITKVFHPGLKSHSHHELFKSQTSGHSGIFSFYLATKTIEDTDKFLKSLKYFKIANSLGGVESLIIVPAYGSHEMVSPEVRASLGITDNFVRVSVGIEDTKDLIEDMSNALNVL